MSSIAFRASTGAVVTPTATSIALNNPTGTANDDVLVAAITWNTLLADAVTPPSGWTQIGATTQDGACNLATYWRRWQTGDPTSHTWTIGGGSSVRWVGAVAAYSGVHTTAPVHTHAFASEGVTSTTSHASPAVTTTVDTWLINVFADNRGSTWTPPTGETEREDRRTASGANEPSLELCDSNGDRSSGSQGGKTATASATSADAVMAQIALEPAAAPPTGGNGTRTSQARIFRSTQTAPNAGTIADLTTAFGTAANASTSAQYSVGGTATWRRFVPNSVAGTAQDPATVSTASGQGWRDTVAQNANESVIVNAGTWTVRTRLTKTGQTIAADIVVRVVAIVYRVNSSGVHQAEIGRVQMADTTLSTSTLTLSGSFTTASDTAFAAGDKVQVECYVTPVAAGLPAAPAAAVNVNFVVDETSANSGASLTAIPLHRIAYARAFSVTTAGTLAFSRRVVLAKNFSVSGVGSVTDVRRLALAKTHSVSGVGVASSSKRLGAVRVFSVAAAGAAGFSRRLVLAKAFLVTGVGTPEISKVLVLAKQFSVTTVGAPGFSRRIAAARSASVTGVGTPEFSRGVTAARAYSVTGVGTPEFSRLAIRLRSHSVSAVGTAISATSKALSRSFSVASAGTATMVKSLNFDRRFSVAASAVAKMRIEIPEAVLDRMVGGGTTIVNVVKKFFPVFDD